VFHRILRHYGNVFAKCNGISYTVHLIKCVPYTFIYYTSSYEDKRIPGSTTPTFSVLLGKLSLT
jgi:hypothetical protein